MAERVMKLINQLYGEAHANLRQVIWEKGFKQGHAPQHSMSKEMIVWLDAALFAHYSGQIYGLLNKADDAAKEEQWQALMKEMFADNYSLEIDAIHKLLSSQIVSNKAKDWLRARYTIA